MASAWTLTWHRLWTLLHGRAFYAAAVGALLLLAAMVDDFLQFIAASGSAVSRDPFQVPIDLVLNLATILFALYAAVSVSREREQGTLLVLSFGPMSRWGYLLSWLAAQTAAYVLFCVMLAAGAAAVALLSGLACPAGLAAPALLSVPAAVAVVAFGLLVGCLARDTRTSILIFLGVTVLLVGAEALNGFFVGLKPAQVTQILLPLSQTVAGVTSTVAWVSPFGHLARELNAAHAGDWPRVARSCAAAVLYAGVLLFLARIALKRRGVRP